MESKANDYVQRALAQPFKQVAQAVGEIANEGRIMPGWPTPAELERAVQNFGVHAVAVGPQLGKQIDRGEQPDVYRTELPKAMLDLSGLLDKYRRSSGGYYLPAVDKAIDGLREVHAKIQAPAIVQHVIEPARREIGQ